MNLSDIEAANLGRGALYALVYVACVGFAIRMAWIESQPNDEDREQ